MSKKKLPECLLCTKLTIQHKYIRSRIGRTLNEISVNWCGRGRFDDGATIPADIERTSYRLIPVTMPASMNSATKKWTQHKNWSIGLFLSFYGDSAYIRYRAKCVARMCCTNYESSAQLFDYLHCCSLRLANLHCKTKCFTHLWAFLYGKNGRKVFLEVYNFTDSNKTKEAKKNHARVWNVQIFPFGVCVRFASIPFIRLLRFVLLLHNADIMEIISLLWDSIPIEPKRGAVKLVRSDD